MDGTTHLLLSPLELIEKLAALVPLRWLNLVRYHAILAPNARHRRQVVPDLTVPAAPTEACAPVPVTPPHRLSWAVLLARVFALYVTICPACGGRLHLTAALTDPASVRRYLSGVGLPSQRPPLTPPRPPSQAEWDFA